MERDHVLLMPHGVKLLQVVYRSQCLEARKYLKLLLRNSLESLETYYLLIRRKFYLPFRQKMLKKLKKSLKGSFSKLKIPCFVVEKRKSQIPGKKVEVKRKSKPLWQCFEESPYKSGQPEGVVICEVPAAEKSREQITLEFHSGDEDLETPLPSTKNVAICITNPPPATKLNGGSLVPDSSCNATKHHFRVARSSFSCGNFIKSRPTSNIDLPRNLVEPCHTIKKSRIEFLKPIVLQPVDLIVNLDKSALESDGNYDDNEDSMNERIAADNVDFSLGNNESSLGENEADGVENASLEVANIDWDNIESVFEEDELYENIQAPKFFDFFSLNENQNVNNDDEAWFFKPECGYPKTAEDILVMPDSYEIGIGIHEENMGCDSPAERSSPTSVLEPFLENVNTYTITITRADEIEEEGCSSSTLISNINARFEEEALIAAHRKQIEDTMEIVGQEIKVLKEVDERGSLIEDYLAQCSLLASRRAASLITLQEHLERFQHLRLNSRKLTTC